MSHWCHKMVNGAKCLISYQRLAFLSSFGPWQLIQNLAPSSIIWRQCDIEIVIGQTKLINFHQIVKPWNFLPICIPKISGMCFIDCERVLYCKGKIFTREFISPTHYYANWCYQPEKCLPILIRIPKTHAYLTSGM